MIYQEIKKKREEDTNKLFTDCGVFWAFSNKQFDENKTPLQEGEKYVDIGAGGYIPKHNLDALLAGTDKIDTEFKNAIKENKARETHILYELNNHESYYTGSIESAMSALGDEYSEAEVLEVYKKFKDKKYAGRNLAVS